MLLPLLMAYQRDGVDLGCRRNLKVVAAVAAVVYRVCALPYWRRATALQWMRPSQQLMQMLPLQQPTMRVPALGRRLRR